MVSLQNFMYVTVRKWLPHHINHLTIKYTFIVFNNEPDGM